MVVGKFRGREAIPRNTIVCDNSHCYLLYYNIILQANQVEIESGRVVDETDGTGTLAGAPKKVVFYDPSFVNQSFKLESIKMSKFYGIYHVNSKGENFKDYLLDITRLASITCEITVSGPFNDRQPSAKWEATLEIEKVFISRGKAKTAANAQSNSARNGFHFLRARGLGILMNREVKDEHAYILSREMLENATVREKVSEFLDDENILKIVFPVDTNDFELEVINVLAEKHSLTKLYEGTGSLSLWKVNSFLHKMKFSPIIETVVDDKPSVKFLTKKFLTKNPQALRYAVEEFVKEAKAIEIQFDKDLTPNQKDLIEILAEKHKLIMEFDQSTGYTLLSKGASIEVDKPKDIVESSASSTVAAKRVRNFTYIKVS